MYYTHRPTCMYLPRLCERMSRSGTSEFTKKPRHTLRLPTVHEINYNYINSASYYIISDASLVSDSESNGSQIKFFILIIIEERIVIILVLLKLDKTVKLIG